MTKSGWLGLVIAPLAGYFPYALIAAFTTLTLVPDTKWELVVLGVLAGMAMWGKLMDIGSEGAAGGGSSSAKEYRRAWHLDD